MSRRAGRLTRRVSERPRRTRVLIYCGGDRTEPEYFEGLRGIVRSLPVVVDVRAKGRDSPLGLVKLAARFVRQHPSDYDEVWCVVDIEAAAEQARRHGVHLAVSNPCFELWLLLHHEDCRSHCSGYADVAKRLKRHIPAYDKTRLRFADYAGGVEDAVERARNLNATSAKHGRNPSTSVWRLVEQLRRCHE